MTQLPVSCEACVFFGAAMLAWLAWLTTLECMRCLPACCVVRQSIIKVRPLHAHAVFAGGTACMSSAGPRCTGMMHACLARVA